MEKFILNSLAVMCPELAEEWHPTKNLPLTSLNTTYGSNKKVWWQCRDCSYEWQSHISNRRYQSRDPNGKGTGCPNCADRVRNLENSFAMKNPELIEEWHPTTNLPDTPYNIAPMSSKKFHWVCKTCEHEWNATAYTRSCGAGCPQCGKFKNRKHLTDKQVFEKSNQTLILKSKFVKLGQ